MDLKAGAATRFENGIRGSPIATDGQFLYIRPCYEKLFDLVWASMHNNIEEYRYPHVIVNGTPGIGKSVFGYYTCARSS